MLASVDPDPAERLDVGAINSARICLYRFLSAVLSDPRTARWEILEEKGFQDTSVAAADLLRGLPEAVPGILAPGELSPQMLDLRELIGWVNEGPEKCTEAFDLTFGLVLSKECPPYETEYCRQTFCVYRSHRLADIAGYYHAFGVEPSPVSPERHDHVANELEFMAWLIAKELHANETAIKDASEKMRTCRKAQRSFFEDHLAWWAPAFAFALRRKVDGIDGREQLAEKPESLLGLAGFLLAGFVAFERVVLGVEPPTELVGPNPSEESEADQTCGGCERKHQAEAEC